MEGTAGACETGRVLISVLDMFKIGVGPSSSHTVGPMVAAKMFVDELGATGVLERVTRVRTELFGSLGATGWGHGTMLACVHGLAGEDPATVDVSQVRSFYLDCRDNHRLPLRSGDVVREVEFHVESDLVLDGEHTLPYHPNAMTCTAWLGDDEVLARTYYSIGGGFVVVDDGSGEPSLPPIDHTQQPFPFRTGTQLIYHCHDNQMTVAQIAMANEGARRPEAETRAEVLHIWDVMRGCIEAGMNAVGTLPGGLNVQRRAHRLRHRLELQHGQFLGQPDPLVAMDFVALWALAVNEENAGGGRVVTAPTNGAAGIIPAVLQYAVTYLPGTDDDAIVDFLLTAAAIGSIFKTSASISGAEVGCQGEVGTASAMAAAGLAQIMGGTPQQVINAAEIALEHHLGLTCDPVGGLVQVPCIERNAVGAIKAITGARLAIAGDGRQMVTLDECVRTMMQTGLDMASKYKETATGGLAVNIVEC